MKGRGKRIVVDADVGRGAADETKAERGLPVDRHALWLGRCLRAFLDAKNVAVFSPVLWDEWRRHMGINGTSWLTWLAERGLLERLDKEPEAPRVRALVIEHLVDGDRKAALKDLHLVGAASYADRRILSCDGKAREKFSRLAPHDDTLGKIHWVEPENEAVRQWILARTPDRPEWTLGGES